MKYLFSIVFLLQASFAIAHGFDAIEDSIASKGLMLKGTMTLPAHLHQKVPLVIIIAGSGPTDRDCNSAMGFKSDAFKKLANYLVNNQIASFRYDKRGVGASVSKDFKESDFIFSDYVDDAKAIVAKYANDPRFSQIIIAGHSEGSLIGMLAATEKCKYISISGPSDNAGVIMKKQLKGQLGPKEKYAYKLLDSLMKGHSVTNTDKDLDVLFRSSVIPYMKSWFSYTPSKIIKKVTCPILIINGTTDLQVGQDQATALKKANPKAQLAIINKMNHVLVESEADQAANLKTYSQPSLPLSAEFLEVMLKFIKS